MCVILIISTLIGETDLFTEKQSNDCIYVIIDQIFKCTLYETPWQKKKKRIMIIVNLVGRPDQSLFMISSLNNSDFNSRDCGINIVVCLVQFSHML